MRELLADIAVIAATVTTYSFLVPQIIKLVRTRDTAGVSIAWAAMGLATNLGWLAYLSHEALWASLAAPLGPIAGYAVTLWALRRAGRSLGRGSAGGAGYAAGLALLTAIWGWTALGVALGLSFGMMMAPSLWVAYRTPDPSGIAPGTWWLGITEALLWGFYGWHHADAGIITFSVTALAGSAAMLARYAATRSRAEASAGI